MTNRPPLAHLHRCDGARNMARFYRLHLERTLFGEWALVRTFGRIGTRGRSLALVFPTRAAALLAFERQRAAKLKRGYGPA
ncbi:WGR domain-containing protein [Pararhizobium haloflavum]|uniref:WGR domain-containing protein n=1 Tax=Pararhizobium haloflavum TaxID=2037914 RepID=UPI000C17FC3C|nr:WGR domain-containing protein [Pararhizobium haloflavum]